jgi:hypothetical protein
LAVVAIVSQSGRWAAIPAKMAHYFLWIFSLDKPIIECRIMVQETKMFATKFMDHAAYSRKVKKMSYSELHFTIKDCREVLKAWPDQPNYGYYADEICYCADEIRRRQKSKE